MTTVEFSNQFDILYDNIASKSAPGLDLYEKSVYLTKAQLELIKDNYTTRGNKYQDGFERTEKRRADLRELIRDHKSNLSISSEDNISTLSQFFGIPNDTFLIIQESVKFNETTCSESHSVRVKPITHDEYSMQINNPFKQPDSSIVWRLDYYSQRNNLKNVELISPYSIKEYHLRYIKYPSPIILTDLTSDDFIEMNLSIDGETNEQTCMLNTELHREILDRAVELATRDYRENNLQNKIQTNLRNE